MDTATTSTAHRDGNNAANRAVSMTAEEQKIMNAYEAADFIEECQLEAAVGELSPQQLRHLNEVLPDWREVDAEAMRTEAWMEELEIGYSSSVESAGSWLLQQQKLARGGKMPPEHRARLDEKLPGWLSA